MKKLVYGLAVCGLLSCGGPKNEGVQENQIAQLQAFESKLSEEESTRNFIKNYLGDLNSSDWKTKLPNYLQPNPEEFLEEHSRFRESFPNYISTIKHLVVEGNEAIVWINITANYAASYTFEGSDYGDEIIKGIEAKNQALSWDEIWHFNVVDGKFGDKWDFLKDNHKVLKDLNANK